MRLSYDPYGLGCSFCRSAFHAPRSTSKNRKMFVVVARVNHNDKCSFLRTPVLVREEWSDLNPIVAEPRRLLLADRHRRTRCVVARCKRVVP
jgi:hypothetical protein